MPSYPIITLCGSTRSEIGYAKTHGKKIMYLEPVDTDDSDKLK
mgnify:CR=1 FL=1